MTQKRTWTSYRDEITKATVFTLNINGEPISPASHVKYYGIQVFSELKKSYPGDRGVRRYFPVIHCGPYGEDEYGYDDLGMSDLKAAKTWAERKAEELGMIQKVEEKSPSVALFS